MEQIPEQEIPTTDIQDAVETAEAPTEEAPTKSVKNFWERLDEVFSLSKQTNQNLEQILEQFPEVQQINQGFHSAVFQPERISLCSNDDIQPSSDLTGTNDVTNPYSSTTGHYPSEYFSDFRIRLQRPLRNVKSIQMLSAVIPNATTNIPDSQTFFWWYKLRDVSNSILGAWNGAVTYYPGDIVTYVGNTWVCGQPSVASIPQNFWIETQIAPSTLIDGKPIPFWTSTVTYLNGKYAQYNGRVYQSVSNSNEGKQPDLVYWKQITLPTDLTRPNYFDLNMYHLKYVYLAPTWFWTFDKIVDAITQNPQPNFFNRTFQDYQDVVNALNFCLGIALGNNNSALDITFQYNATLNKIILVPNPTNLANKYYYLPCGYEDPNIPKFMSYQLQPGDPAFAPSITFAGTGFVYSPNLFSFVPQSILNTRLGFTWNGRFPDPYRIDNPWANPQLLNSLYWYLRNTDPIYVAAQRFKQSTITANSYGDLVNTSCVRIYCDFTFGSTQDSLGSAFSAGVPTPQGLLSVVPVNTNNLGVGFYQNNFDNPLTKIPQNITEIGISMLTDQGLPFYLPNSATVLLELGITYH